jgi:hypothetical protein
MRRGFSGDFVVSTAVAAAASATSTSTAVSANVCVSVPVCEGAEEGGGGEARRDVDGRGTGGRRRVLTTFASVSHTATLWLEML